MIIEDCLSLLRENAKLNISIRIIEQAFALSKKEQVAEFEKNSLQSYHKMIYIEFLEFLTRISELYFEGSEM